MQAIVYRLKELSVISEASYRDFFNFMERNGYNKDESELAEYKGEEKGLRFDQLLGQALVEEYITILKAAALKNQRLTKFRNNFLLGYMRIAVTDASIFIDLLECEVCESFFKLSYNFITSYQIWMELEKDQREVLSKWRDDRMRVIKIERDFVKSTDDKTFLPLFL